MHPIGEDTEKRRNGTEAAPLFVCHLFMNTGTISNSLPSVKTTPVILNGSYSDNLKPSITNPITNNNNQGNPKSRYGEERGAQGGRAARGCPPAFFLPLSFLLY